MLHDSRGHRLAGATAQALPHYETALRELNLFINDPVASADKAIAHHLPTGMIFDMTGEQYIRDWSLPQAAFHQMIAYAILRQAGVPDFDPPYTIEV